MKYEQMDLIEYAIAVSLYEPNCGDRANEFCIGDQVAYKSPLLAYQKKRGIGNVVASQDKDYLEIVWQDSDRPMPHPKIAKQPDYELIKAIEGDSSGIFSDIANIPELSFKPRRHGIIEDYLVSPRKGKHYKYQRYVYLDDSGTYRHHHIAQRQHEAIATMWRGGASAKEICVAIGKKYLGKDI